MSNKTHKTTSSRIQSRRSFAITILFACSVLSSSLFGHDELTSHDHRPIFRENQIWELAQSGTQFEGDFIHADDQHATIQLKSGRIVKFAISRFSEENQQWLATKLAAIRQLNEQLVMSTVNQIMKGDLQTDSPAIASHFQPFVDNKSIEIRWDRAYLYVESDGIPNHEMMTGITAWQQQVPIPQQYSGNNAWQIPLSPTPAAKPLSAKSNFFRGAIALAVNGVPIFNPIKNDGRTDTNLAGELDKFGGHCGRADDYHYHLAPVHLEKVVGKGNPIAYALDGYPIYGYQSKQEQSGSKLDTLNGHKDNDGNYHYHATRTYPYLNGGFYGNVNVAGGQVTPQPRATPIRPASRPLRGAKITGFEISADQKSVTVRYSINGATGSVGYTTNDFKTYQFTFNQGRQGTVQESYSVRPSRDNRQSNPRQDKKPRPDRRGPPKRNGGE